MRITLTFLRASAPNSRMAMPGTPTMPSPSNRSRATREIEATPRTPFRAGGASSRIQVPGKSGFIVFLMTRGMFFVRAGWTVGGYTTFAPKCDNSMSSSYRRAAIEKAPGTIRGSALITPSTSVQISMAEASRAAPKIAAV